jgi:hypothetical protein
MTRYYVLADESGNLDFSRSHGASLYFAVGTLHVIGDDRLASLRADLLRLKTELAWAELHGGAEFGAAEDAQAVRDAVFAVLEPHEGALDVTLFEKSKAQPHLRSSREAFLRHVWRDHFGSLAPLFGDDDEVMIIVSSIGTHRLRRTLAGALDEAVRNCAWKTQPTILFAPSAADPALQAADYLLWAVMRWRHRSDPRSLDLVRDKVRTQRDAFGRGTRHYY